MKNIVYDSNDNAILSRQEIEDMLREAFEAGKENKSFKYVSAKQKAMIARYYRFDGEQVEYRANKEGG